MENTKLKQWLTDRKIKFGDAADALGVTRQYLSFVINGGVAGKNLAIKIEDFTGGEITAVEAMQL